MYLIHVFFYQTLDGFCWIFIIVIFKTITQLLFIRALKISSSLVVKSNKFCIRIFNNKENHHYYVLYLLLQL